jgi:hypothetical protein
MIPTLISSQGRAVAVSKNWVSNGKARCSSDQRLMLDKAARALIGQEPIMKHARQPACGSFEFAAGLGNAHQVVYEHDAQCITRLAVYDRQGNTLAEVDARDLSAQTLSSGKRSRVSDSPDSHLAQRSRSVGPQAANPALIHETRLPLEVNVAGQHFHVGPLRKRLDTEQQRNFQLALLTEPKQVVNDSGHQGYRALSFIVEIDNAKQFVTVEFDQQRNLRGAAGQALSWAVINRHLPLH